MTGRQVRQRQGNVVPLNRPPIEPSHERLNAIQRWHRGQAESEAHTVASLNISITVTGTMRIEGICIEPEHATAMLLAIPAIRQRLVCEISGESHITHKKRNA